jgi:hypothetical protein
MAAEYRPPRPGRACLCLLRDRSGKGAFLVTEQLAFQQIQRNGSAIQLYEGAPASRAEVVNRLRDQFLAGACLSFDKNGGICRGHALDLFKYRLQGGALAYDLLKSASTMYLVTELGPSEGFHRKSPVCSDHSSLSG